MAESIASKHELIEGFLSTLRRLPDALVVRLPSGSLSQPLGQLQDIAIRLELAGRTVYLPIEVKRSVYPRDVRELSWQVRTLGSSSAQEAKIEIQPVLISESISPGAKELLRTEGIGYYDSGGSLYLSAAGIYLYIDKPDIRPASFARALFTGRRAQVIHALLVQPEDWFGVVELAKRAQVSPSTVSQVLIELDRMDWVKARGRGPGKERLLHEPGKVLDAWVKQLPLLPHSEVKRYYVPRFRGDALLEQIDQAFQGSETGYAVTHEAAAQRYAPYISSVSQVRIRLVEGFAAMVALGTLDARSVQEGANLAVIQAESEGELLFRRRIDGAWLASPLQVYLDLMESAGVGRSKEMAEHLRKEAIGF